MFEIQNALISVMSIIIKAIYQYVFYNFSYKSFDVGQIYIGNDGSWYVLKQEESLAARNPYLLVSLVK